MNVLSPMPTSAYCPKRVSRPWIGDGEPGKSPGDSQNREDKPGLLGRTMQLECTGLNKERRELHSQRASENCTGGCSQV